VGRGLRLSPAGGELRVVLAYLGASFLSTVGTLFFLLFFVEAGAVGLISFSWARKRGQRGETFLTGFVLL